jgi:hypothetical protein
MSARDAHHFVAAYPTRQPPALSTNLPPRPTRGLPRTLVDPWGFHTLQKGVWLICLGHLSADHGRDVHEGAEWLCVECRGNQFIRPHALAKFSHNVRAG